MRDSRKRISLGLTALAALLLAQCTQTQSRRSSGSPAANHDPQQVLTLITAHDPAGSFEDLESTLERSFSQFPNIENTCRRIDSLSSFRGALLEAAANRGPLDGLLLAFHGQENKLHLGPGHRLHQRNLPRTCRGLGACLKPGAPVILYACLTGGGEDNLARDLADVLDRPVIAPTHYWLMQTAVPRESRVPELTLDTNGKLTVATAQFALYYKARLETGKDRHLIAPEAMHALCLRDGFERKSSRFRPLFQRYFP